MLSYRESTMPGLKQGSAGTCVTNAGPGARSGDVQGRKGALTFTLNPNAANFIPEGCSSAKKGKEGPGLLSLPQEVPHPVVLEIPLFMHPYTGSTAHTPR